MREGRWNHDELSADREEDEGDEGDRQDALGGGEEEPPSAGGVRLIVYAPAGGASLGAEGVCVRASGIPRKGESTKQKCWRQY